MKSGFEHLTSKPFILMGDFEFPISQYSSINDFELCSGISRSSLIEFKKKEI